MANIYHVDVINENVVIIYGHCEHKIGCFRTSLPHYVVYTDGSQPFLTLTFLIFWCRVVWGSGKGMTDSHQSSTVLLWRLAKSWQTKKQGKKKLILALYDNSHCQTYRKAKHLLLKKKWLIIIHNIISLDNYRCASLNEMQNPCMLSVLSWIHLIFHCWSLESLRTTLTFFFACLLYHFVLVPCLEMQSRCCFESIWLWIRSIRLTLLRTLMHGFLLTSLVFSRQRNTQQTADSPKAMFCYLFIYFSWRRACAELLLV